jgi:hypothetical protein
MSEGGASIQGSILPRACGCHEALRQEVVAKGRKPVFDILEGVATPISNDFMSLLDEFRDLQTQERSNLTLVELPDGVTLPDDAKARAIMLAALFRRGLL